MRKGIDGVGVRHRADRVVTNAHVVAGVASPLVELPGRAAREGRVVYFDPVGDLAVIAVDHLDGTPLPIASTPAAGADAVVQDTPGRPVPTSGAARVLSVGPLAVPDIYQHPALPKEVATLARHGPTGQPAARSSRPTGRLRASSSPGP